MRISDLFLYTKNLFSIDFYVSSKLYVRMHFFQKMGMKKISFNYDDLKNYEANVGYMQ